MLGITGKTQDRNPGWLYQATFFRGEIVMGFGTAVKCFCVGRQWPRPTGKVYFIDGVSLISLCINDKLNDH
jgi:hypothetical protein